MEANGASRLLCAAGGTIAMTTFAWLSSPNLCATKGLCAWLGFPIGTQQLVNFPLQHSWAALAGVWSFCATVALACTARRRPCICLLFCICTLPAWYTATFITELVLEAWYPSPGPWSVSARWWAPSPPPPPHSPPLRDGGRHGRRVVRNGCADVVVHIVKPPPGLHRLLDYVHVATRPPSMRTLRKAGLGCYHEQLGTWSRAPTHGHGGNVLKRRYARPCNAGSWLGKPLDTALFGPLRGGALPASAEPRFMYSLDSAMYSRVLECGRASPHASLRVLYYVPFDSVAGLWGFGANRSLRAAYGLLWRQHLSHTVAWQRCGGCDHFLVLRHGVDYPRHPVSAPTALALGDPFWSRVALLTIDKATKRGVVAGNLFAMPFVTALHPRSTEEVASWQAHVASRRRHRLLTIVAGERPQRQAIFRSCTMHAECHLFNLNRRRLTPSQVYSIYLESTYCLMPLGDAPTRKATTDALVCGCIPVVFADNADGVAYPWYFDVADAALVVRHPRHLASWRAAAPSTAAFVADAVRGLHDTPIASVLKAIRAAPYGTGARKLAHITSVLLPRLLFNIAHNATHRTRNAMASDGDAGILADDAVAYALRRMHARAEALMAKGREGGGRGRKRGGDRRERRRARRQRWMA